MLGFSASGILGEAVERAIELIPKQSRCCGAIPPVARFGDLSLVSGSWNVGLVC